MPPEEVVATLDLSLEALTHPEARVPLSTFTALVRRAERLTGEPGLAYHAALSTRVSWHGFVGFAAMTAGTLGEALELAERFGRTRTDAVSLVSHREGDSVSVLLEEHVPLGELREFFVTALFLGIAIIGEGLAGRPLEGRVEVRHAEPSYFPRFLRALPALGALCFGQPIDRIVIPSALLALPIVSADPAATRLAREQCERELAALGEGSRVVTRLRGLFLREGFVALPVAARALGVSTRTLKRRLAEQQTTFSGVQDDVRRGRALVLLNDPRISLDEIAARLGYSDTANFSRAFRRWTGATPGEVRARGRRPG
ncbi:MAG: AraC family transcriptional regulator ligand-binding domain-containing protein [Myxococcales bacterium]|nr:AraC family transcriptional regulator ligand-binding domain-containing protein [Myxococcales bacterium]